jgi:hypothetical protein
VNKIDNRQLYYYIFISETRPLAASWEILKPRQDQESTPMEIEIRTRRIERSLKLSLHSTKSRFGVAVGLCVCLDLENIAPLDQHCTRAKPGQVATSLSLVVIVALVCNKNVIKELLE